MTFDEIRTKLASLEGRRFWRSLDELSETPAFMEYLHREFPANASEFTDPKGRRQFLRLMGASIALAGVAACTRQPEEEIVPYVHQPEAIVPGRPLYFATAMSTGGYAMPMLATSHMGRPTKLDGNPEHPAALGGTDIFGQASVLGLYDPDRSQTISYRGELKSWPAVVVALQAIAAAQKGLRGRSLRFLSEPITSPTLIDQIELLQTAMPEMKWHQWDPVYGTVQGGATEMTALYRFDKADIVVSLDADFLGCGPAGVRYSKDFSSRRRIGTPQDQLNRLYVVEPVPTITGAKAEHRLPLKARDVHAFAAALASGVGAGAAGGAPLSGEPARWASVIAADLQAHRGRSVVVAGDNQPAAVHAIARAINEQLGNVGTTVSYMAPLTVTAADGVASVGELVADMRAGHVDTLIILGANPVFTAPADLDFSGALKHVSTRIHLGLYEDETANECDWHIPETHHLEEWGDLRAFDGTVTMVQPLIAPLYENHQPVEILAILNGQAMTRAADLLKDYWARAYEGKTKATWTLRDAEGKPFANATSFWKHAIHDGFIGGTSSLLAEAPAAMPAKIAPAAAGARHESAPAMAAARPATVSPAPPTPSGMEIVFRPDPNILDGRFANNGWLQELPKPLSKVTWDNVAYVSARTAERLGIEPNPTRSGNQGQQVLEVAYGGRSIKIPVWVMPGTADDVVAVHFGYGRKKSGRVGNAIGVDVYPIRTSKAPWFDGGATVTVTSEWYDIAATQNHFAMEERNPVRVVDADHYRTDPDAVRKIGANRPPANVSLFKPYDYSGEKWGMSIDLNACTGCGVCTIACQAENNIAVTGKDQVMRTREMHWVRVDTYFEGDLDNPKTYNQPVPCQQCEDAPCELVCPVAATSHNDEGLNDMVYNRCVGTRYCSNNCPYKVRRFNFLLYTDYVTESTKSQRNPDVTPRSRGVMEKCTYCVQRISHARIDAKTADRPIRDGDIKTACQQACPSNAIVFGNLNEATSQLAKLVSQDRNYGLLEDVGTRPRTTYLAVVRNPNPALETK